MNFDIINVSKLRNVAFLNSALRAWAVSIVSDGC